MPIAVQVLTQTLLTIFFTFFVLKDMLTRIDASDLLAVRFTIAALVLVAFVVYSSWRAFDRKAKERPEAGSAQQ